MTDLEDKRVRPSRMLLDPNRVVWVAIQSATKEAVYRVVLYNVSAKEVSDELLQWLKERGYVRQDENSDYVITGDGADYVESHLPTNQLLHRLLKAAEMGSTRSGAREVRQEQASR